MSKNKFFYCGSTQALLYALAHEEYIVISNTSSAKQLCKIFNRRLIPLHDDLTNRALITRPYFVRKEVNRVTNLIDGGELHFSHTQFAIFCFLLVDKLAKKGGNIFFHDFEFEYQKAKKWQPNFRNAKQFFRGCFIKLFYRINLSFKVVSDILVPSIDQGYLKNNNINFIKSKNSFYGKTLALAKRSPIIERGIKNIFLTQNLLNTSLFDREELLTIYSFLNERQVFVKLHPGMVEEEATVLDKILRDNHELPVEFLLNSVENTVISVHSAALVVASKFDHLKSISLLDLLNSGNDLYKKKVKQDLIVKSEGRILFPGNFHELEKFLNE